MFFGVRYADTWKKTRFCGAVLALILFQGCISMGPARPADVAGMTWSVVLGKDRCRFVKLTDDWINLDDGSFISISDKYEFRSRQGAGSTEFLVSAERSDRYTQHKFLFDLSNPGRVWPIEDVDWKDAAILPLTQDFCELRALSGPTTREQRFSIMGAPTFACDGRDYAKTGKWFGVAVLPPSHNFIALGTWNGEYRAGGPPYGDFIGPRKLDAFIDVYSAARARNC